MLHSIISFNDKNGITIDFHRLKQKKPETVLNAVYKGFAEAENLYLNDLLDRCCMVEIHYTEYETTDENRTYKATFDEFMENYKKYKQNNYNFILRRVKQ